MKSYTVKTPRDLGDLFNAIRDEFEKHGGIAVDISALQKQRTLKQNKSLHLYCEQMAAGMNEAGFTQRQLVGKFKDGFELPVTCHMIKDIFREVGEAMYQKESTADLTTTETIKVYEVVDARFGEITGVRRDWPSRESLMGAE